MSARLVFLGKLEDVAGAPEREVAAGPLDTILADLPPNLSRSLCGDHVRMALNGALIAGRSGVVLGDGDELAFLPPVSGG